MIAALRAVDSQASIEKYESNRYSLVMTTGRAFCERKFERGPGLVVMDHLWNTKSTRDTFSAVRLCEVAAV
jgi:hypothetical protein